MAWMSEKMDVREIAEAYLAANGFDGLFYPGKCGCLLSDLMPCGNDPTDCMAGYKLPGNEEFDFLVGERLPGSEPGGGMSVDKKQAEKDTLHGHPDLDMEVLANGLSPERAVEVARMRNLEGMAMPRRGVSADGGA